MKIQVDQLASIANSILRANGVDDTPAALQVDLLLQAELRGFASHGMLRLPRIVERIHAGVCAPNATGRHHWRRRSFLTVDGEMGLGPVVVMSALAALEERARSDGIAIAAIRNNNHIGMLGWYGEQIAARGLVLIGMTTSEALVHPWGGRRAMLGTNPLCIAVPAEPAPLVLDMATGLVSMGRIHDHAIRGEPIPRGWALDAEGNPTMDAVAAKAGAIAPFGEAKGYALGLALEVLVTSLSGADIGTDVVGTLDSDRICNKGDVFIVIDGGGDSAAAALVHSYLEEIRHSRPADPAQPVSVPGDRARRTRARNLAEGIDMDPGLWRELRTLAGLPNEHKDNLS